MPNELLNPVAILKNTEARFENAVVMPKFVSREYDDKFAVKDEKVGATVNARLPVRYRGSVGEGYEPEDTREVMKPISVNRRWKVCPQFSDIDLTLTIDRFAERYLESASVTLANKVDLDLLGLYKFISNLAPDGVPGTAPTTRPAFTRARAYLEKIGVPDDRMHNLIINPDGMVNMIEFGATMLNPQKELSDQYLNGNLGQFGGMKVSKTQNVRSQQLGAWSTTSNPIVSAAAPPAQGDTVVNTTGWANDSTLKAGDIVEFVGAGQINMVTWEATGVNQCFAVPVDVACAAGTGNMAIPLPFALNADTSDVNQTVSAIPAASAAVRVYHQATGAAMNAITGVISPQYLVFHRDAFVLVTVRQTVPKGMDWSEQIVNKRLGIPMRIVRGFDIRANDYLTRIEILGGVNVLREDFAVRLAA